MEFKGISRRLDLLGRIVLPGTYRKMMGIKKGDPVEIIAISDSEIKIKKLDIFASLEAVGASAIDSVYAVLQKPLLLTTPTKFILEKGFEKPEISEKEFSQRLLQTVSKVRSFNGTVKELECDFPHEYIFICPVKKEDFFGTIMLFSQGAITENEEKIIEVAASMLANSLQKF